MDVDLLFLLSPRDGPLQKGETDRESYRWCDAFPLRILFCCCGGVHSNRLDWTNRTVKSKMTKIQVQNECWSKRLNEHVPNTGRNYPPAHLLP